MPSTEVTDTDQLIAITADHNKLVQLVCHDGKHIHCGVRSSTKSKRPIAVYNLEIYRKHIYSVGPYGVLVHNVYTCTRPRCFAEFHSDETLRLHVKAIHQSHQPGTILNLDHTTEFICPSCREPLPKSMMDIHIKSAHIPQNSLICDAPDCYAFFTGRNKIKLLQAHRATHIEVLMKPTDLPDPL